MVWCGIIQEVAALSKFFSWLSHAEPQPFPSSEESTLPCLVKRHPSSTRRTPEDWLTPSCHFGPPKSWQLSKVKPLFLCTCHCLLQCYSVTELCCRYRQSWSEWSSGAWCAIRNAMSPWQEESPVWNQQIGGFGFWHFLFDVLFDVSWKICCLIFRGCTPHCNPATLHLSPGRMLCL